MTPRGSHQREPAGQSYHGRCLRKVRARPVGRLCWTLGGYYEGQRLGGTLDRPEGIGGGRRRLLRTTGRSGRSRTQSIQSIPTGVGSASRSLRVPVQRRAGVSDTKASADAAGFLSQPPRFRSPDAAIPPRRLRRVSRHCRHRVPVYSGAGNGAQATPSERIHQVPAGKTTPSSPLANALRASR